MRIVIFYTVIHREYQNACLLKAELTKRGHEVYILDMLDTYENASKFKDKVDFVPDVVLTSYLYREAHLKVLANIFKENPVRVINLQYEQILSGNALENNSQLPHGKMVNAIHICWGNKFRKKLIENGIPEENAIVTGSLNIDMCRERFINIYKSRENVARENKLDINKKWIIFIGSFVFAEASDKWRDFHYNHEAWDKERVDERIEIDTKSRTMILDWIKTYLKDNDCEFIYRPHPSEEISDSVYDVENEFPNFHIIRNDSIRTWIKNCDKINTWMSTSITEIYFMGKNCSILRPIEINEKVSSDMLSKGKFLTTYEEFCEFNNNDIKEFPIDENLILDEFYINKDKYAYEIISDLIEDTVNKNIIMDLYD